VTPSDAQVLVSVRALGVTYGGRKHPLQAVSNVTFDVRDGETFAIIGESGSGKTTLLKAIAGLVKPTSGTIETHYRDNGARRSSTPPPYPQVVFQDPDLALNPRVPVWKSIVEPLAPQRIRIPPELRDEAVALLRLVGLDAELADRRPHQLSGGQRQRVTMARALSSQVPLVLFDEPLSGQDVSLQAVLLRLLERLRKERALTYVIVSHNVAAVARTADRVGVMYASKLVELGDTDNVLSHPRHPYTQALVAAVPRIVVRGGRRVFVIQGEPPDLRHPPSGCHFRTRCAYAIERCANEEPVLRGDPARAGHHQVACHRWEIIAARLEGGPPAALDSPALAPPMVQGIPAAEPIEPPEELT